MKVAERLAILLAAGKGERLWPLTTTRPKPLLPVVCKPLLLYHLENLYANGYRSFIVVVSYKGEVVRRVVDDWTYRRGDVRVEYVEQGDPLGTGHAVAQALRQSIPDNTDNLLIVYGDVYLDEEAYRKFLSTAENTHGHALMLGARVDDVSRFGQLVVDKQGYLRDLREKPQEKKPGLVNAGLYLVETDSLRRSISSLKPSPRGEYELTDAFKIMLNKTGVKVASFEDMIWSDVGTPWDYLILNRLLVSRKNAGVKNAKQISEKNEIEGNVYIDNGVELGSFNRIRGPSVICKGAKIGFSVEIKASVLLENARVPHLSYVGDSIVGEGANLGAGTITANLRHDDAPVKTMIKGRMVSTGLRKFGAVIGGGAKTGINTSILPGVKIGAGAWVGAGCILARDVPDYALVKCSQDQKVIMENRGQ